jgi:hypothetical protein
LFSDDHVGKTSKQGSDLFFEEIAGLLILFSVPLFLWILYVLLKRRSTRSPQVKQPFENSNMREAESNGKPKMAMRQVNFESDLLGYLNKNFQYITLGMLAVMLVMVFKQQSDISSLRDKVSNLSSGDNNLETKVDKLEQTLSTQLSNAESNLSDQVASSEKSIQQSLFVVRLSK